jgi:seryl-tRNA synthetase
MIDLKDLRENPDKYLQAAAQKRVDADIPRLLELDKSYRGILTQQQTLTAEKHQASKLIGPLMGKLSKATEAEKADIHAQVKALKERPAAIKIQEDVLQTELDALKPQIDEILLRVPQPADTDVPVGKDDTGNVELRTWGSIRKFDFEPKDHITLGHNLGLFDIERGVKLAGSRSYFLLGAGAMLHQAVLRFAQDLMIAKGFTLMQVPVLVREPAMRGTGYFPLGREQSYAVTNEDPAIYLVGTSEVPVTAFHMDETLEEKSLPRKYIGTSPCFRREAGTYGKDTQGLYRIHQFDKVEQVVICKNDIEESKKWHQAILANSEELLQALDLPYRVVHVCTGDLGQGQAAKFDIETWMPSRNSYGETHSASRFYDFQARRLNLRYRDAQNKIQYCHTLNNTVVASPRVLIPILELYQNADGTVTIPKALRPYMNGLEVIK